MTEASLSSARWAESKESGGPSDRAVVAALLGLEPALLEVLRGGRNSRVVKVTAQGHEPVVVKFYHGPTVEGVSRLDVEVGAVTFMRSAGLDVVPDVVASRPDLGVAAFEFVPGRPVQPGEAEERDVDALVAFLAELRRLSSRTDAASLPHASEAAFSVSDLLSGIQRRLIRLRKVDGHSRLHGRLHAFLDHEFQRALEEACATSGRWLDASPPTDDRTLSPSDTGFHNAIRRPDGRLVFHDFEYFGWDAPAKLCADVVLHPRGQLQPALAARFMGGAFDLFGGSERFRQCLVAFFPFVALKWAMIALNEFNDADLARRLFAGDPRTVDEIRTEQLGLATAMVARARSDEMRRAVRA